MKKLLFAVTIGTMLLISCNTGQSGDPKSVLTTFFDHLAKKDIESARKLATADSKGMLDLMEMGMKMADSTAKKNEEQFDKSRMEIGDAKIDGDRATVPVKEIKSGETVNFVLKKESGDWKVAFDMGTMMNIGMEKMKENGMDNMGDSSMKEQMEKFKNMSTDSIKMMMEKGAAVMDSMKKMMNKMPAALDSMQKALKSQ